MRFWIVICALFLAVMVYAEDATMEAEDAIDDVQILLAYEKTAFKNALVDSLIEELEGSFTLTTVLHNKQELTDEVDTAYDAVIIVNSGVNSQVRPWVTAWLNEVEDTEKIILLTTYRDLGWKPRYPEGVDSITSPSNRKAIGDLVVQITEKVDAIVHVQDDVVAE